jgi:hypothetical protein
MTASDLARIRVVQCIVHRQKHCEGNHGAHLAANAAAGGSIWDSEILFGLLE